MIAANELRREDGIGCADNRVELGKSRLCPNPNDTGKIGGVNVGNSCVDIGLLSKECVSRECPDAEDGCGIDVENGVDGNGFVNIAAGCAAACDAAAAAAAF